MTDLHGAGLLAALRARDAFNRKTRGFFEARGFLEVETPFLVPAPGTDPHLDPVAASVTLSGAERAVWLHTSPEFAMKRLLAGGAERIYQICKVWRDGEVTDQHHPEFTILEWYRSGADYEAIMDDVESLVRELLGPGLDVSARGHRGHLNLQAPFLRLTMREAWLAASGVDPVETAGDFDGLRSAAIGAGLELGPSSLVRWDELFFYLMLTVVEPWLTELGPVFVTEWPAPLAVLARRKPSDGAVAERFELYLRGVEVANGFGELTDPQEQRARFEADNNERLAIGKPALPIPEQFLAALARGLPPCAGVAVGLDRLLMLGTGAATIDEVLPGAAFR